METLRVPAKLDQYEVVENFILDQLPQGHHSTDDMLAFRLAAEEVFMNIVSYAYGPEGGDMLITCNLAEPEHTLTVKFTDKGMRFNPLEIGEPNLNAPLEERDVGGLGIFLTTMHMDDVTYNFENDANNLTIKRKLG